MKWTWRHEEALEALKNNLRNNNPLPTVLWIRSGVPTEDIPEIIEKAKKEVAAEKQPLLFNEVANG